MQGAGWHVTPANSLLVSRTRQRVDQALVHRHRLQTQHRAAFNLQPAFISYVIERLADDCFHAGKPVGLGITPLHGKCDTPRHNR